MKRIIVVAALVTALAGALVSAEPASAQGGGCQAFGQSVATLARTLGPAFGQTASANAPLSPIVEAEQDALCP